MIPNISRVCPVCLCVRCVTFMIGHPTLYLAKDLR